MLYPATRIVILGIGNPLRRDDGTGIRIIQELQSSNRYQNVTTIDGGTSPDLTSLIEAGIDKLIIVDTLKGNGKAGDIYRLEISDRQLDDQDATSLHGMGILDSLKLMKALSIAPNRVIIIGVEPFDTSQGLELTAQMQTRLTEILSAIDKEIIKG